MRRWKLKLIVGGILALILSIFVFVPFNVEAYSNQGYQFIAYKRIITDSGGEEVNQINIIADLSSEEINFSNSIFTITTYLNKSWSASYGNEVDLDLMELNSYYLINRLLNYDEAAYFVTKLSAPFDNLEAIFDFLGISYNQGYNEGYEEGYNRGYEQGIYLDKDKNLISASDLSSNFTLNGLTFINNQNGTITINGTCTQDTSYTIGTVPQYSANHTYYGYTGIKDGSLANQYYIQFTYQNENNVPLGAYDLGNGVKYKTPVEVPFGYRSIYFRIAKGISFYNATFLIQLYDITGTELENLTDKEIYNNFKYVNGYNDGYTIGEKTGYTIGVNQGTKDSFTLINFLGNIISVFFSAAFTFLSFEVFGIKLWEIFSIAAAAAVIIVVYRLIKGGGD